MATRSCVLAWRIPGMVEPHGLPSVGFHRVGHDWSDLAAAAAAKSLVRQYHWIWRDKKKQSWRRAPKASRPCPCQRGVTQGRSAGEAVEESRQSPSDCVSHQPFLSTGCCGLCAIRPLPTYTWVFHGQGTAILSKLPLGHLRSFSCIIQTRVGWRRACPRQQLLHKCVELHVTKQAERGYKLQYISNYTQVATEESDSERRYFRSQRLLRLLTCRHGGSTQDLSHRWAGLFHHAAALSSWGLCVWHPFGSHRGCQLCVPLSAVTGRQASCSSSKCFLHWEGYTAIPGFPGGSHCNCDELLAQRWPCWVCTAIF